MVASRAIVSTALRKLGRVGGGRDARPADLNDGFEGLVSLYRGWMATGAFGRMADIAPDQDYTVQGPSRIYHAEGRDFDVILPEFVTVENGYASYHGSVVTISQITPLEVQVRVLNGQLLGSHIMRLPRDVTPVIISDYSAGNTIDFLYDATRAKWVPIYNLTLDDEAPLSFRDSNGLASCLAVMLSDQWGADVAPATTLAAHHFRVGLTTRFASPRENVRGIYF